MHATAFYMGLFGALLLSCSAYCADSSCSISFSGVLGQSQPIGKPPVPFIHANGVFVDSKGGLWTAAKNEFFCFNRGADGVWTCQQRARVPSEIRGTPQWDGEKAYFIGGENLYAFDPESQMCKLVGRLGDEDLERKGFQFATAPAGMTCGYAKTGKFFFLQGLKLKVFDPPSKKAKTILVLPKPCDADFYSALCIEPKSGDLLFGGYFPDGKVYRYSARSGQVSMGGWPRSSLRPGHPYGYAMTSFNGGAWLLSANFFFNLPDEVIKERDVFASQDCPWIEVPNGLCQDKLGFFWISCTQGLIEFDRRGIPTGKRLGGISGVSQLVVMPGGELLALVDGNQRFARLAIDDSPDAIFSSHCKEAFQIGAGGWLYEAAGASVFGMDQVLVLDGSSRQLRRFFPGRTEWGGEPWVDANKANSFKYPKALAVGESLVWVMDGQELREASLEDLSSFRSISLPEIGRLGKVFLSAIDDNCLVLGTEKQVYALSRAVDGVWRIKWRSDQNWLRISGITVSGGDIVVADYDRGLLTVMAGEDGEVKASVNGDAINSTFRPSAITAAGAWLFVADELGSRILRFKIEYSNLKPF